jgi:hypothetical protein
MISAATDAHPSREELLESVFPIGSGPRLYSEHELVNVKEFVVMG